MSEENKAPGTDSAEESEETKSWVRYADWLAKEAHGEAFRTSPGLGYREYGMTTAPVRRKQLGIAAGIAGAGTAAEYGIKASAMFDPALAYARRELAEAEAREKEAASRMTYEEKEAIRRGAIARAETEVAETKSDIGALMASTGDATVTDILAAREAGVDTLATAGLEAESLIAQKDLAIQKAHEQQAVKAEQRADEMQQTLFEARQEGRDNLANLFGEMTKISLEYAENAPAADVRPAVNQLRDAGMPMGEIQKLHKKAVDFGFYPGSRVYHNFMMKYYEPPKTGTSAASAAPTASAAPAAPTAPAATGEPPPSKTVQIDKQALAEQSRDIETQIALRNALRA